jgi:hypothetical protein
MQTSQHMNVSQINGSFIRCEVFVVMTIQVLLSGLYCRVILFTSKYCRKTKGQNMVTLIVYLKYYFYGRLTKKFCGKLK